MFLPKEFGSQKGAIIVTSTIAAGVYTATAGHVIYAVVPDPSCSIIAEPKDTTKPWVNSTRASGGVAIPTFSGFTGQFSKVTVPAGQCFVYEISESPTL